MRTCVVFNPAANGERARQFRRARATIERESTLLQTTAAGEARALAAQAVEDGFEAIVAAGGDGTLNEVLNGIGDAEGFERACLGVLPLGTANVFARELAIPLRATAAWGVIRARTTTKIDLPTASFVANGTRQRRHFAQLAGAGWDARAVELASWPLKKRIGPLAYVLAGFRALQEHLPEITVASDRSSAKGRLVLVGNGRRYGGRYRIFPQADARDGILDSRIFPELSWLTLIACGLRLLASGNLSPGTGAQVRAASLTLASDESVPLQLDGELVGHLPATFSVEREKLRVLAPGGTAARP